MKNRLIDEENELSAVSNGEQRDAVTGMAASIEEWLYDAGKEATVSDFRVKHHEIRVIAEEIFHR